VEVPVLVLAEVEDAFFERSIPSAMGTMSVMCVSGP
jgi:hypothetical protein